MEITESRPIRSDCPISFSLELFGDKWTLLIIRDLMLHGKRTYQEFLKSDEKIASNIARERLVRLTREGFITIGPSKARRWNKPYLLTEKGIDLAPLIFELAVFGTKYGATGGIEELLQKALKNRTKAIADFQANLRKQNALYAGNGQSGSAAD